MTQAVAKSLVKLLSELFPNQLTPAQAREAAQRFKGHASADVERAIKDHRAAHEFVNWPQLYEGCRAAAKRGMAAKSQDREGTWCDVFRRQNPQLEGRSDVEVILRVHRAWWHMALNGVFGGTDASRHHLKLSCVYALMLGPKFDQATADAYAATVFEESPEYFRQVLEDLRANEPQLQPA